VSAGAWPAGPAPRRRLSATLLVVGWVGAAILVGALAAAASYRFTPALAPAACAAVALAMVTLSRPEVGIAAWFVMVPLARLGWLGDPPWLLTAAWAAFLFTLALVRYQERQAHTRFPLLGVAMVGFTVVTVAGVLLTDPISDALPPARTTITGTWLFFAVATLVRDRAGVIVILLSLSAAAAIAGAAAILERRTGGVEDGFITSSGELVARVSAGFGQPNQLAGFLVVLVPLTIAAAILAPRWRIPCLVATAVAVIGVYLTFSRSALIALAVVPIAMLGIRGALLLVPMGAAALGLLAPGLLVERFATLSSGGSELASRQDFWTTASAIWQSAPVLGVGPGGFPGAYATVRLPGKEFLPTTNFEPPPHAHNLVLHTLAEQGIVGLTVMTVLAGTALLAVLRLRRNRAGWMRVAARALLAAFAAFFVHNLFDVTLLEGTGEYMLGLLGFVAALTLISSRDDTSTLEPLWSDVGSSARGRSAAPG